MLDRIGVLPTVFLAFTFQFNMFPIYSTLKTRTDCEMKKASYLSIAFCFVIYCITGFVGYYMYRNTLKDTIISALTIDVIKYKNTDGFLIFILVIINIGFLLASTMSIPLMFFSLKNNFINSIIFCKKKFGQKRINPDQEKLLMTADNDDLKGTLHSPYLSNKSKNIIIVVLYFTIGIITILVPGLKIVK